MTPSLEAPDASDPRIPVWNALSALYLDTDVAASYGVVVRALAESPYSLDALHDMLMYDVHPALYRNLLSMVGEWAGFDEVWLVERIAAIRRQPRWRRRISHWFASDIGEHWHALAPMIRDARSVAAQP